MLLITSPPSPLQRSFSRTAVFVTVCITSHVAPTTEQRHHQPSEAVTCHLLQGHNFCGRMHRELDLLKYGLYVFSIVVAVQILVAR